MRYHRLDLNLLVVLDKLLSEGSVSRTAAQLNMSQPAISNALARLRTHFDDELFVPVERRMAPTPFAEAMRDGVRSTVEAAQRIATTRASFDPATAARTYTIVSSDQAYLTILTAAIRRLARTAPNLCIRAVLTSRQRGDLLRQGVVDFIINPRHSLVEEHPSTPLFSDRTVALAWTGNRAVSDPMTMDQFTTLGHVDTTIGDAPGLVDRLLAERGLTRRIAAYAPTFVLIAETLVGTDYIGCIGSRPASVFEQRLPLRRLTPPLDLGELTLLLQWHRSREGDPGIIWMREFLKTVAEEDALSNSADEYQPS